MKHHLLLAFTALLYSSSGAFAESGEVVFREDFESDTYQEGSALSGELGVIHHGQWGIIPPKHAYSPVVSTIGGARCVELSIPPDGDPKKRARLIGLFGKTNREAEVITDGLHVTLSFQANQVLGEDFYIQIIGSDGKARASLTMNGDGRFLVAFGGKLEEVEGLFETDRWYRVEFKMPKQPATRSEYEFSLYDQDQSLMFHQKGRVARAVEADGNGYTNFEVMHRTRGAMLLVDDIVAKTSE